MCDLHAPSQSCLKAYCFTHALTFFIVQDCVRVKVLHFIPCVCAPLCVRVCARVCACFVGDGECRAERDKEGTN